MRTLRLKIADLLESAGLTPPDQSPDLTALTPLVLQQYGFLPQPLTITLEGDDVVLQFPKESSADEAEAARLAQKGAKRAGEGDYPKAVDLLKRALKLQPSFHTARRDLAMTYMEMGDIDNATNHLIEVLRLDPTDAWSWVVLGNLYLGPKKDLETGEKFLRKALALKPDDAWALNSLATLFRSQGKNDEALRHYEQAIAANPELANPYVGAATVLDATQQPDQAAAILRRLFAMGRLIDTRTQSVYGQAFWAGEKYTFLEMGWAVYIAEGELPEGWLREHGETRAAEEDCNELASGHGMLVTSHPVLVALSLRAWWHRNGREIPTAPVVTLPTFEEAVEEVRRREILNDFNRRYAGEVPGLRRWQPPQP